MPYPYTRDVERRKRLLAFWPQGLAPTPQRQAALQRARSACLVLDEVMRVLADPDESERSVLAALRMADGVAQATDPRRTTTPKRAAMELVDCIKFAADMVLDRGIRIDLAVAHRVSFGVKWPDLAPLVDPKAFRGAVEAWIESEQAMRRRGRRLGRTPEKWKHVHAALASAGLGKGLAGGRSLAKTWERHRNSANP